MSDLLIVCPSRQRPHAVGELARALGGTCTAGTAILWCVDTPAEAVHYERAIRTARPDFDRMHLAVADGHLGFIGCLNRFAVEHAGRAHPPTAVASLGDDHRPATVGWDSAYLAALADLGDAGIVYGDDGHQGQALPTQMAMSTSIVRALGYVAPPQLWHMYCDNFWKDLGEAAGCITYLPDVEVTHHHPGTGTGGTWDDSYRESNSAARYAQDAAAYRRVHADGTFTAAVAAVTALRGAP